MPHLSPSSGPVDDRSLDEKFEQMQTMLRELESVAVAFSAGVDSTLVLKVALDVLGPHRVLAVTGRSDSLARAEFEQAVELATEVGAEHVVLDTDEFQNPSYTSNPANRCYFCKTTLYDHMARLIRDRGIRHIVNGINADDLGDYRPGIQAAREHDVRSPAAEAGLTKADVRELSRRFGLPTFDKPASPCLSSRVPYGQTVTPEKLRMIEAAEQFLHSLGFRECRVRHYEGAAAQSSTSQDNATTHHARIEVSSDAVAWAMSSEVSTKIQRALCGMGYAEVTIDPRGFRSGSMNELLNIKVPASAAT